MKSILYAMIILSSLTLIITCKKSNTNKNAAVSTSSTGGGGLCVGSEFSVYNRNDPTNSSQVYYYVMGRFLNCPNDTNRIDGGTVTLNGINIPGGATTYYYSNSSYNTGVMNWVFSGDTIDKFSAFSDTSYAVNTFTITSGGVNKSSGYTVSHSTITNADTIFYTIYSNNGDGTAEKFVVGNNITGCTFSSSELSTVDTSNFVMLYSFPSLTVEAVSHRTLTINDTNFTPTLSKKYLFHHTTLNQKIVTINN